MAIPNVPITPVDFSTLQGLITQEVQLFSSVANLAFSGLQYVADISTIAPSVDLIGPYSAHDVAMDSLAAATNSNFTSVVTALNTHIVTRGTTAQPGDTTSARLNRWLTMAASTLAVSTMVSQDYANISLTGGFVIESNLIG